jgi:methylmalonyl-CoA mutase N-terminal domain/subunit
VAHESGVADTIDPLGGSYYVEAMTDSIAAEAEGYIRKIDDLGGMVAAIETGYVQSEIQRSAYRFAREVEAGKRIVVGVNKFQSTQEAEPTDLLRVKPEVEDEQIKSLNVVKLGREAKAVARSLGILRETARGDANLMPPILDAVKSYATVGEICNTLREVFGEYKERIVV